MVSLPQRSTPQANRRRDQELNVDEVAQRVGTHPSTVMRWIEQGKLAARCVAGHYQVNGKELRHWAMERGLALTEPSEPPAGATVEPAFEPVPQNDADAPLCAALRRGGVILSLDATERDATLAEMVAQSGVPTASHPELLQALLDREALASTGVGHGVAIPHPRTPLQDGPQSPIVVATRLTQTVEWGAVDGKPVDSVFIVVAPNTRAHLETLARLSYCVHEGDFLRALRNADDEAGVFDALGRMEQAFERQRS